MTNKTPQAPALVECPRCGRKGSILTNSQGDTSTCPECRGYGLKVEASQAPAWKKWELNFSKYYGAMFECGDFEQLMGDIYQVVAEEKKEAFKTCTCCTKSNLTRTDIPFVKVATPLSPHVGRVKRCFYFPTDFLVEISEAESKKGGWISRRGVSPYEEVHMFCVVPLSTLESEAYARGVADTEARLKSPESY